MGVEGFVANSIERFEELHIVSDLHLGGSPGKQIFAQTTALAGWIDHLAAAGPDRRIGLVLNGDIVDFLAGDDPKHFDPLHAARKRLFRARAYRRSRTA